MSTIYSRYTPLYDRMPGVSSTRHLPPSGYTPSLTDHRRPPGAPRSTSLSRGMSPTRKTSITKDIDYSYGSRPSSRTNIAPRALPNGAGPLDSSGRKLSNFSISSRVPSQNGPIKATQAYATSYTSSYGMNNGTATLGRHGNLSSNLTSSSSSRPGSMRGRRSSSLANIKDGVDSLKITDDLDPREGIVPRGLRRSGSRTEDRYLPSPMTTSRSSRLESDDIGRIDTKHTRTSVLEKRNSYNDTADENHSYNGLEKSRRNRAESPLDNSRRSSRHNSPNVGSLSRFSNAGKVGLRNLGNTCFMNSVLQCLSNTKLLVEYCLTDGFIEDKNTSTSSMKGSLITAYANLMKSMWVDKDSHVSPNSFKSQIQRFAPRFTGYAQQDAQEFLRYLLEGLHEDVNMVTSKPKPVSIEDDKFSNDQDKAKEYWRVYLTYDNSYIVDLFVGQLKSTLSFEDCGHTSVTFDPFWDLSLPIPKIRSDVNINKCISLFMKEEVMDMDERPTCSKCKKRRACTKSFSIQRFPKVLVLHLKRFSQGRYSQKVSTTVEFPQELEMTEYSADRGGRVVYNLYAVSNHSGGTHSGHYTATCRHPYSKEWHIYNDTRVSPSSADRAVSSEAYLLFYELKTGASRL